MKKAVTLFVLFLLMSGCTATRMMAPVPLPHVRAEFESAEFWINRLEKPQAVLMSAGQIRQVNAHALATEASLKDIFAPDLMDRSRIANLFSTLRKQYRDGFYFDQANRPVSAAFFDKLFSNMAEERLPAAIVPAFGLITRSTELRELPTENVLMRTPDDIAFDALQYARLACGTPVAVLHYTADRQWCLVQASFAPGWVRALDVGVGSREEVERFISREPLVVTGEHADVYADRAFAHFAAALPMGAGLPSVRETVPDGMEAYRVLLPGRGDDGRLMILTGYLKKTEDVHPGYLPYTGENVLRQAFKLYGQPYGWGGLFGGRDCSRFIHDIFRCFGFNMPVNSFRQAHLTAQKQDISDLKPDKKIVLLKQYDGRPVLLYMKGHIMLYLGVVDSRVYAIHSTWAYRERAMFSERLRQIGGVVVSDLSLGENSARGSLIDRVRIITPIQ